MSQITEDKLMTEFNDLPPIILASKSPRRKKILEEAGLSFKIVSADVEEKTLKTASETVQSNAKLKCDAVAKGYPNHLIIAADTVVSLDDTILEKPETLDEAKQMLTKLSGRSHQVMTAVSIAYNEEKIDFMDTSSVHFKSLTDESITLYTERVNPFDKAGAYNIDESGEIIIERFKGEYENIMGLPISSVLRELKKIKKT